MTLNVYTSDSIGAGVRLSLPANDQLLIGAGVTMARTDAVLPAESTLRALNSGNTIDILGSLLGGGTALELGDAVSDGNYNVRIYEGGLVRSFLPAAYAIEFIGFSATIINEGSILSQGTCIYIDSAPSGQISVNNSGHIISAYFEGIERGYGSAVALHLVNSGLISGSSIALGLDGSGYTADNIVNTGSIVGNVWLGDGNDYFDSRGGSFVGTNASPAYLNGGAGSDQLYTGAGSQDIQGGLGDDMMAGGAGDDIYRVDSVLDLVTEAASQGVDTIMSSVSLTLPANVEKLLLSGGLASTGTGNALANTIYGAFVNGTKLFGLAGNDTIYGNNSSDTIDGGAGNDTIDGVGGADTLNGGLGNDTLRGFIGADKFVFNTKPNSATNRDTILEFEHLNDRILLENAIFTKLGAGTHALSPAFFHIGTQAADANDYVIYNSKTGALSYDPDGNAAGGAVVFALLKGAPVISAADFLVV